jgi:hypothetical protein
LRRPRIAGRAMRVPGMARFQRRRSCRRGVRAHPGSGASGRLAPRSGCALHPPRRNASISTSHLFREATTAAHP